MGGSTCPTRPRREIEPSLRLFVMLEAINFAKGLAFFEFLKTLGGGVGESYDLCLKTPLKGVIKSVTSAPSVRALIARAWSWVGLLGSRCCQF